MHPPPAWLFGIADFSSHLSRPYNDTCRTPPPPAGIVLSGVQKLKSIYNLSLAVFTVSIDTVCFEAEKAAFCRTARDISFR